MGYAWWNSDYLRFQYFCTIKNHISTNAKRTARVENLTAANITATRVDDVDAKTLRFGMWDNSTNSAASISSVSNSVAISFSS